MKREPFDGRRQIAWILAGLAMETISAAGSEPALGLRKTQDGLNSIMAQLGFNPRLSKKPIAAAGLLVGLVCGALLNRT